MTNKDSSPLSRLAAVSPFILVPVILLVVLFVGAIAFYSYVNGLQQEGVTHETGLNAQYLSNQNYLSAYISGFYEQVGVANLKSDKLDAILLDAVKGRYESSGGFAPNGAFFSAIQEAYPDLTANMNIYDKIIDYIQAKREGYRNMQDKFVDMLRTYDNWRSTGFVRRRIIKYIIGAPTDDLVARIGADIIKHGQAALDQMYLIVNTESVQQAYKTGKMEPLAVPTPTPKQQPQAQQAQPAATATPAPVHTPNSRPRRKQ